MFIVVQSTCPHHFSRASFLSSLFFFPFPFIFSISLVVYSTCTIQIKFDQCTSKFKINQSNYSKYEKSPYCLCPNCCENSIQNLIQYYKKNGTHTLPKTILTVSAVVLLCSSSHVVF
jgi:hypothetical protein